MTTQADFLGERVTHIEAAVEHLATKADLGNPAQRDAPDGDSSDALDRRNDAGRHGRRRRHRLRCCSTRWLGTIQVNNLRTAGLSRERYFEALLDS